MVTLEDEPAPKGPPEPTGTNPKPIRTWKVQRLQTACLIKKKNKSHSHAFPVVVSTRASRPMRPIRLKSFCRTLSLSVSQLCTEKKRSLLQQHTLSVC